MRRSKADRVNPMLENPEIVFKSEPNKKNKDEKMNGVKSKYSTTIGNDKSLGKNQILESASRIIKEHGSDKKSNSPASKIKKEDREGLFVPPGLARNKTMATIGSPRNFKSKDSQKAADNLTTRLEDIKHIRN